MKFRCTKKKINPRESSDVKGQRYQLRQRGRQRAGSRRRSRRGPADGTRGAHPEPLIDAINVKAVVALRNPPYRIFRPVLRQANAARAVVGPGQAPALAQHGLRVVGLDDGLVQAQHDHGRGLGRCGGALVVVGGVLAVAGGGGGDSAAGFDADAGVGGEHDGGDEDEDGDGDGDAVAEADAAGGL